MGVPALPLGAAKTVLADWEFKAAVSVPDVITGELLTVKMEGIAKPTLVTVPTPTAGDQLKLPKPLLVKTPATLAGQPEKLITGDVAGPVIAKGALAVTPETLLLKVVKSIEESNPG